MAKLFKDVERQLEFVVFQKLPVLGQKRYAGLLVAYGCVRQGMSCTLKQRFSNLPAFDQFGV